MIHPEVSAQQSRDLENEALAARAVQERSVQRTSSAIQSAEVIDRVDRGLVPFRTVNQEIKDEQEERERQRIRDRGKGKEGQDSNPFVMRPYRDDTEGKKESLSALVRYYCSRANPHTIDKVVNAVLGESTDYENVIAAIAQVEPCSCDYVHLYECIHYILRGQPRRNSLPYEFIDFLHEQLS